MIPILPLRKQAQRGTATGLGSHSLKTTPILAYESSIGTIQFIEFDGGVGAGSVL